MKIKFVSIWDRGVRIETDGEYDPITGRVEAEAADAEGLANLEDEFIETPEGDEFKVCMYCHEYVMKLKMADGVGKSLYERHECSDPECVSHDE